MKLYYGTYGHHISGKLYVYWGDDNLRSGQQVVAPVTSKQTGKTYNTMFTIARGVKADGKIATDEAARLAGAGITIKTLGGRDLLSLPGGKDYETKIDWKRDSDWRYENKRRKRLGMPPLTPLPPKTVKQKKTKPILGENPPVNKSPLLRKKSLGGNGHAAARHSLMQKAIRDNVSESARSALLSRRQVAADSFDLGAKMKLKQRKAFKE